MPITEDRHLHWDGCANVRDLGGLPTAAGGETRRGALVRADALSRLTGDGWSALLDHGVRTVIDLRNDDELEPDVAARPLELTTVHVALDGIEDAEFWAAWTGRAAFGTPLYYRAFLDHFPQRPARVLAAIAHARPGGVAVHCGIGRDRTGLIAILVLALAGVTAEDIAADYALSSDRVRLLLARLGEPDHVAEIDALYDREGTTAAAVVIGLLATLDVEAYLRAAGLGVGDLAALRARVVES